MEISGKTRLLGLFGTPVGHSKSPAMYNYCFRKFNLDWAYLAFDVPLEKTSDAIQSFRTLNMVGANVTMPLKKAVIPYLDELTPAASAIQAVNTIVNRDGKLIGNNTDGCGYTRNLESHGISVRGKKIVLMGGGGAASAIAVQAALEGAKEIDVFNIKDAFYEKLENTLASIRKVACKCQLSLHDLDDRELLEKTIEEADILSNATRVGMAPHEEESNIKDLSWFRKDLIVTDVVYNPSETKMLRDAKKVGCRTCDGLGMLLYQGAEAFKLYSGLDMPVEEIRNLLYK